MPAVAFLDANALYLAALRDLLVQLGVAGMIEPRWSDRVHEEWIGALLRDRPDLSQDRLQRTRALMEDALLQSNVGAVQITDDVPHLPDPDDRHVLAAALIGSASLIVTFNTKDFPLNLLEPLGVVAVHPDAFLAVLLATAPEQFCAVVRTVRTRLQRPITVSEYLDALAQIGLVQLAQRLRTHMTEI